MSKLSLNAPQKTSSSSSQSVLTAIFKDPHSILQAARALTESGYRDWETFSPHPIHGIDDVSKRTTSVLPYLVALGAIFGIGLGLWMPWYFNKIDYPLIISGKPLFAIEPSIPVAFELAILLAAFGAFGGMFFLSGFGRYNRPELKLSLLPRITDDGFVLVTPVETGDETKVINLLEEHGVCSSTLTEFQHEESSVPPALNWLLVTFFLFLLVPPAIIAKMRVFPSEKTRIHLIGDMDWQPKFKAQAASKIFPDGRAARPQVPGTIAVGELRRDPRIHFGKLVRDSKSEDWINYIPLEVDQNFVTRGRERYQIFCATCHGSAGDGDGLVTARALELEQGTWVRPTSLHEERIRNQPVGQLYDIITNGVRKMPGYAAQIDLNDRWAIAAYVKALQKTRNASIDAIPEEERSRLVELQ